jgi:hypothetical protein
VRRLEFLRSRGFHLCMTIVWALMAIPTALWWNNSVLWVGEMSVYACMTTHWGSYQGARAEHTAGSGGDGTEDRTGEGSRCATPGPDAGS